MKTYIAKKADIKKNWHLIDANEAVLGRLATKIAFMLRGKDKAVYTPYEDTGDFVVVINAEKIKLTGDKLTQKEYHHHTHYPGGLKTVSIMEVLKKDPGKVITHAVKGMLPKNKLSNKLLTKLKVYAGPEHPHSAQIFKKDDGGKQ